MSTTLFNKTGLETLPKPENSALILIDHQPFQFASLNSHDPQTIINNVIGLAKIANQTRVVVHQIIAVGDYVWAHLNVLNLFNNDPDDTRIAGVDI